jgi:hypothetical protein
LDANKNWASKKNYIFTFQTLRSQGKETTFGTAAERNLIVVRPTKPRGHTTYVVERD